MSAQRHGSSVLVYALISTRRRSMIVGAGLLMAALAMGLSACQDTVGGPGLTLPGHGSNNGSTPSGEGVSGGTIVANGGATGSTCNVCRSCRQATDCGAGGICAHFNNGRGVCTVACSGKGTCPGDALCFPIQDNLGQTHQLCLNPEALGTGVCPVTYVCGGANQGGGTSGGDVLTGGVVVGTANSGSSGGNGAATGGSTASATSGATGGGAANNGTATATGHASNTGTAAGSGTSASNTSTAGSNPSTGPTPASTSTSAQNPWNPNSACVSNRFWRGDEGTSMNPGEDCAQCHGHTFVINGTVYHEYHEQNQCYGVTGAVVEITDANGHVHRLQTTSTGNFAATYGSLNLATPYTAKVTFNGKQRAMMMPQTNGDCATCHTQTGANGAPGRIIVPW